MADAKIAQKIEVGPTGTTKGTAMNLGAEAKAVDAKVSAEGKAAKIPEGGKKYKAVGANSFNTPGIKFNGPYYITADKKEQEILDSFVERGFLTEEK